nr:uncharacterized protein LOC105488795 [Macaca nemestrina]
MTAHGGHRCKRKPEPEPEPEPEPQRGLPLPIKPRAARTASREGQGVRGACTFISSVELTCSSGVVTRRCKGADNDINKKMQEIFWTPEQSAQLVQGKVKKSSFEKVSLEDRPMRS